jgi:hypothetical protein
LGGLSVHTAAHTILRAACCTLLCCATGRGDADVFCARGTMETQGKPAHRVGRKLAKRCGRYWAHSLGENGYNESTMTKQQGRQREQGESQRPNKGCMTSTQ